MTDASFDLLIRKTYGYLHAMNFDLATLLEL